MPSSSRLGRFKVFFTSSLSVVSGDSPTNGSGLPLLMSPSSPGEGRAGQSALDLGVDTAIQACQVHSDFGCIVHFLYRNPLVSVSAFYVGTTFYASGGGYTGEQVGFWTHLFTLLA